MLSAYNALKGISISTISLQFQWNYLLKMCSLNKLRCLQESEKYCIRMPNKWNFSFDFFYAAILALGIYVPGINSDSSLEDNNSLSSWLISFVCRLLNWWNDIIYCRQSSLVWVYAWAEEESSLKVQEGVEWQKILLMSLWVWNGILFIKMLFLAGTIFGLVFSN